MGRRALLFDLDDTLVVEDAAATAAFEATGRFAAGARADIDAARLTVAARARARELWRASPVHAYCLRVGISSSEALWCRFEGDDAETRWLRGWSPAYRRETWRLALAERGIEDGELAAELGERFGHERRARHELFDDTLPALRELGEDHVLGLVTNGASCLQREKLDASGLGELFAAVVVSGDIGAGKPNAAIFHHALARLSADGGQAVMIGDSLERDVRGAVAAGLGAVWLNRFGGDGPPGVPEITSLTDLRAALPSPSSPAGR